MNAAERILERHGLEVVQEEDVEHYGTKGMRWGVRKRRNEAERKKQFGPSREAQRTARLTKKPPKALTNKQLKEINERLNLEKNYSKLNPGKVSKGQQAVKAVIATGATATAVINLANNPAFKAAISASKEALTPKGKHFAVEVARKGAHLAK